MHPWCMARTNIDIDDEACETVMARYHLTSKRDAVNYALRLVAAEALDLDAAAPPSSRPVRLTTRQVPPCTGSVDVEARPFEG